MKNLLPSIRTASLEGLGFGGLLYGAVIAWLHVVHNRLESLTDAWITFAVFVLLYGLWAALIFGGLAFLGSVYRALPGRRDGEEPPPAFLPGVLVFNLIFWELFFLYGLTYDQAPAFAGRGPWAMVLFLLAAGLLIAALVVLASLVVVRVWRGLARGGRLRSAVVVLLGLGLAATGTPPLLQNETAAEYPAGGSEAAAEYPRSSAAGGSEAAAEYPRSPAAGVGKVASEAAAEYPAAGAAASRPEIVVRETGVDVVFIALDGADWQVLQPMMDGGELPTFRNLVASGVSADLETLPDANSAVIWATVFSGVERERHRVEDFYRIELPGLSSEGLFPVHRVFFKELTNLVEPTGLLRRTLVTRYSHRAVPWWEVADQAGLSIGVVDGYLMSFPAYRPRTAGSYFVSYGADAFSSSLAQRGAKDVELFLQPPTLFRRLRQALESGGDFVWQSNTLDRLLRDEPRPRLLTFYTHEPDSSQHQTWKWYEPERFLGVSAAAVALQGDVIPQLHRDFDGFLAELRRAVGEETAIIVASDHGHSPTLVHKLYTQHRHGPPGILIMDGGPFRAGLRLEDADVYDLFPTVLHLLGLPIPEDGPGRVLEEALDPAFLERFPLRTIPSYDFLDPGLAGTGSLDDERNRQELEKLKSLGYI